MAARRACKIIDVRAGKRRNWRQQADPNQDVVLVPAFTGLGAPYWKPDCRGAMFGLTRNSGRAEIARATLESIAFQTRDLWQAMQGDWGAEAHVVLRVDGGMSASDWTMQGLQGQSTVLVFEGPDAAGKGGAIRRTVGSLDARAYRVHQFAAPTDVERAHHYLWRFWSKLPRAGYVSVFDRSWYGRVLVERLEGFATEEEWRRAYNEINDFESQIVDRGILLLKFWLHISPEEQLRRFEERANSTYKHWKLTDEDWRNRELFGAYETAAHDMVQFTSTGEAPWILVEGDSKHHARLKVLTAVCEGLEKSLAK